MHAVMAALAMVATADPPSEPFVIVGGQEALVQQMLTADALPSHCRFQGAAIASSHVDARFDCYDPAQRVVVQLRHPLYASNAPAQTTQFALFPDKNAPADLAPALARHIQSREASWRWTKPTTAPRKTPPPKVENDAPPPSDPTHEDQPTSRWRVLERTLVVLCLILGSVTIVRTAAIRTVGLRTIALFFLSLVVRCVVPRTPANFYSDLATPFANFRYNTTYEHPFYDAAIFLFPFAETPFWSNIVLGALAPPLLFLALHEGPRDSAMNARGIDIRVALPFAVAIALLPFFARLSASDAPHVFGLFAFALGALHFARAFSSSSPLDHIGFLVAAYLVGATRRELALGPLMYLFLALGWRGRAVWRGLSGARCMGVLVACTLGLFCTRLAIAGYLNSEVELSRAQLWAYVVRWPAAMLMGGESVPILLRVGMLVLFIDSLQKRQRAIPLAYFAGMTLFTLPYATERAFVHNYDHPTEPWSMARYALVWYVFPIFFGVLGALRLFDRPWCMSIPVARLAAGGLLIVNALPSYVSRHAYQEEYRFLRQFLAQDTTNLTLVTGWQKYAGVDFCESLALPFFALSGIQPQRRFLTLSGREVSPAMLAKFQERFYYFSNTLPQIHPAQVTQDGHEMQELTKTLESFRVLDCLAKRHGQVVMSETKNVGFLQFAVGANQNVTLGVYLVEPPALGWDFKACGSAEPDGP